MVDQVSGRAADSGQALVSDQAASRLAPSGFDPSRIYSEQFPAWVAEQNPDTVYDYSSNCDCAFAQFLIATDIAADPGVGGMYWTDDAGVDHDFPTTVRQALVSLPWTFGALAERLQQAA